MYKKSTIILTAAVCGILLTGCTKTQQEPVQISEEPVGKLPEETPMMTEDKMINEEMPADVVINSAIQYTDISVEEAKNLINKNPELIILDVSPKYAEGHLPDAINYYVGDGSLDNAIPTLDPESMYLVYCHNDVASTLGAQKLIDAGFEYVYRLEGNYGAWVDAGYPIEK